MYSISIVDQAITSYNLYKQLTTPSASVNIANNKSSFINISHVKFEST